MPRTRVSKHQRRGTKGVRQHSRSTPQKKKVPHTRKKRKSYKVVNMSDNEIEDRIHSLFIHSGSPNPQIDGASNLYKELGLQLPYQGKTRIGHVNRYAGLNTYYLNAGFKYNEKETIKFIKANIHDRRPAFNEQAKRFITSKAYTIGDYETGDRLVDEYGAIYSEDLRVKWIKENLR